MPFTRIARGDPDSSKNFGPRSSSPPPSSEEANSSTRIAGNAALCAAASRSRTDIRRGSGAFLRVGSDPGRSIYCTKLYHPARRGKHEREKNPLCTRDITPLALDWSAITVPKMFFRAQVRPRNPEILPVCNNCSPRPPLFLLLVWPTPTSRYLKTRSWSSAAAQPLAKVRRGVEQQRVWRGGGRELRWTKRTKRARERWATTKADIQHGVRFVDQWLGWGLYVHVGATGDQLLWVAFGVTSAGFLIFWRVELWSLIQLEENVPFSFSIAVVNDELGGHVSGLEFVKLPP